MRIHGEAVDQGGRFDWNAADLEDLGHKDDDGNTVLEKHLTSFDVQGA